MDSYTRALAQWPAACAAYGAAYHAATPYYAAIVQAQASGNRAAIKAATLAATLHIRQVQGAATAVSLLYLTCPRPLPRGPLANLPADALGILQDTMESVGAELDKLAAQGVVLDVPEPVAVKGH